jgi:cytidylate kinase
MIIAIDGPAGAGKSTISKEVAKDLNFQYVDTGAMYRAITLMFLEMGLTPVQAAERLADLDTDIQVDGEKIALNGRDVSRQIRSLKVNQAVSDFSVIPEIRLFLVDLQRKIGQNQNIVVDGRDIGTYVFPKAEVKVFLTASVEIRAKRRFDEMKAKGETVEWETIVDNIISRDRIDSEREMAPLKKAEDAIEVDTSNMTIDQVVGRILSIVRDYGKADCHS